METPTFEEYQKAREIVAAYEDEKEREYKTRVEAFKADLTEYFKNNLIDGVFELKEFHLSGTDIIPDNPCMEENYNGGNNEDIAKLCVKHQVKFSIIYWCYHK